MDLLENVIQTLLEGRLLAETYRDHSLTGNYTGFRECHILPDWLKCRYQHFNHNADFPEMPTSLR